MSFGYDPEAPAGYQDADLLQAQYEAESAEIANLRRRGFCTHSSWVGLSQTGTIYYPEQVGLRGDEVRCTDGCGQKFSNNDAILAAAPIKISDDPVERR